MQLNDKNSITNGLCDVNCWLKWCKWINKYMKINVLFTVYFKASIMKDTYRWQEDEIPKLPLRKLLTSAVSARKRSPPDSHTVLLSDRVLENPHRLVHFNFRFWSLFVVVFQQFFLTVSSCFCALQTPASLPPVPPPLLLLCLVMGASISGP